MSDNKKNISPEVETPAEAPAPEQPAPDKPEPVVGDPTLAEQTEPTVPESPGAAAPETPTPDKETQQTAIPGIDGPAPAPLARLWTSPPPVKVWQKIRLLTNRRQSPIEVVLLKRIREISPQKARRKHLETKCPKARERPAKHPRPQQRLPSLLSLNPNSRPFYGMPPALRSLNRSCILTSLSSMRSKIIRLASGMIPRCRDWWSRSRPAA